MPLEQIPVERFGGLRLATDPSEVGFGAATDLLNVDLAADKSRVFTRDGTATIGSGFAGVPQALCPIKFGTSDFMLATGYTSGVPPVFIDRVSSGGVRSAVGTYAAASSGDVPPGIVAFGTPTTTLAFIAWSGTQLRKYDGTTLSTSTGSPGFIAVTPQSNRLVQAWFKTATDSPTGLLGSRSTVFFSDPGAPETYDANNFVHLTPGDGEEITGMVTWRDLLFVFKETRAFVFYGESTDPTLKPIFNYRQITLAAPVDRSFSPYTRIASSNLGVYALTTDGVHRTTGGQPVKISTGIDNAPVPDGFLHVSAVNDRVFVQVGGNGECYVYDERTGEWLYWKYETGGFIGAPFVAWNHVYPTGRLVVFAAGTTLRVSIRGAATDSGVSFASRYRTGVGDLGSTVSKVVREILVEGSGNVNVGTAVDWGVNPAGTPVTLGVAPVVALGRSRTAVRGYNMRVQLDATSGAWAVNRMVMHLRSARPVGIRT